MTCWHGETMVKAWRSPKIECIISEHQWMESDCIYSDLVLPVSTKYEEDDIGDDTISLHFDTLFLSDKCIEPVGESMSDYEIACMVADKMGLLKEYTQGKSVEDWIKFGFDTSGLPEAGVCTWDAFKEKRYFVVPTDPKWESYHAGMLDFYNDPAKNRLTTPSGKLEFYSERLAKHFPDDNERPPIPKWIEGGPGWSHDERIGGERAKQYPLLCMSNHPRWRVHAQCDDITWFHEIPTSKVRGSDGYLYEPIWIHPSDAANRGIVSGDVVKVFNERGVVMVGAYVTERIMPGVVYVDHGARHDPIIPGELDRGGAINMITPHNRTSKNAAGMVTNGFLVEVEGINLDELSKKYPEAFSAPYDGASGLCFERILHKGGKK
jgi:anaerobic selenocysteine-containing dehydrogenase